jgi:cellulose synthase/poly-beta-1,6-N-acetylglucosamine synthase-like glycosyltransferase
VVLVSIAAFLVELPAADSIYHSAEQGAFVTAVILLVWGNLVHHVARLGYLKRARVAQQSQNPKTLDHAPARLGILVPSFREEEGVLLQTVLSVALMKYPNRHVVVLVDDPPLSTGANLTALQRTRELVKELDRNFATYAGRFEQEYRRAAGRAESIGSPDRTEAQRLARCFRELGWWIEGWSAKVFHTTAPGSAHTATWFVNNILRASARRHYQTAERLGGAALTINDIHREYAELIAAVSLKIESFERKLFSNLSHQPNKAMNLNSFIGLIGGHYREVISGEDRQLISCSEGDATLSVPEFDFVLTIDADSVVTPNYALTLLSLMNDDPRIAVAQTPYSAFPKAPGLLERVAGATTDLQYVIHQGFTHFAATYWVGANAVLRVQALRDIVKFQNERGHLVPVYIRDRTVIEDTDSTIDLIQKGWKLHNHPQRLAYSATPPDFGSLVIQRQRWANGGLIVLPNLVRHLWQNSRFVRRLPEAMMRAHYLCSPAIGMAVLLLLFVRFDDRLASPWLPLTALPYYWIYGRDVRFAGYSWSDLFRVYALNMLLLPVNLAGVWLSLQQLITGKKSAFGRTPKVEHRTPTPAFYVVVYWILLAYLAFVCCMDITQGYYSHAGFAFGTWIVCGYGFTQFIGWRDGYVDVKNAIRRQLLSSPNRPSAMRLASKWPPIVRNTASSIAIDDRGRYATRKET